MSDDGPTPAEKKAAKDILDKPEHEKPKGGPEDKKTRDDRLDDPALQAP
jgi:hypothetical protein